MIAVAGAAIRIHRRFASVIQEEKLFRTHAREHSSITFCRQFFSSHSEEKLNGWRCWLSLATVLLACVGRSQAAEPLLIHRSSSNQLATLLGSSERGTNAAASCASTACHGGPRPGVNNTAAIRGAEYPAWLNRDPHAQAYRSLCSEQGTRILERLKILDGANIIDRAGFNDCLACHNSTQQTSSEITINDSINQFQPVNQFRREGVACDRCHGPSEAWRNRHYGPEWPTQVVGKDAHELGFIANEDLLTRARMCASCHIGDAQRNMNHDMIAAGHPPLLYEFATYHNRLPKHWRDARTGDRQNYESTLWLVGQVAALEAQVSLIEARAAKTTSTGIWPEFAHLNCAACHQTLNDKPTQNKYETSQAGWSRWNRWAMENLLLSPTSPNPAPPAQAELKAALAALERALVSLNTEPDEVRARAADLKMALAMWVDAPSQQIAIQRFSAKQLQAALVNYAERHEKDPALSGHQNWKHSLKFIWQVWQLVVRCQPCLPPAILSNQNYFPLPISCAANYCSLPTNLFRSLS